MDPNPQRNPEAGPKGLQAKTGKAKPASNNKKRRPPTARHQQTWARRHKHPVPDPTGGHQPPPRCPREDCPNHTAPEGRWFVRKNTYWPLCQPRPLKRYLCKGCNRTFSRQSFRMDRWDKKPWLNPRVLEDLGSGLGLRETARRLKMGREALTQKSRKIAHHCKHLHRNMLGRIELGSGFMMDEAVTFEEDRGTNHLGFAVLIHTSSYMILGARAEPMAPQGKRSEEREKKIAKKEAKEGKRRDQTKRAVIAVSLAMVDAIKQRKDPPPTIVVKTDMKDTYHPILKAVQKRRLPKVNLIHRTYKGDGYKRDWMNPLFRINHTLALMRDRMSRLRRRSWLVSKRRRFLNLMTSVFLCFRNLVRPWKNGAKASPAQLAGAISRRITLKECLGWRQDWGEGRCRGVLARSW